MKIARKYKVYGVLAFSYLLLAAVYTAVVLILVATRTLA